MWVNVKDQPFGQISKPVIGFCNKCLYISEKNKIYIINVVYTKEIQEGEIEVISNFTRKPRIPYEIDLGGVKNHAFLCSHPDDPEIDEKFLIICCETSDN